MYNTDLSTEKNSKGVSPFNGSLETKLYSKYGVPQAYFFEFFFNLDIKFFLLKRHYNYWKK